MLETLRRITQEVNAAQNLEHALNIIVQRVKQFMGVDVCSVFFLDRTDQHYVLMATDGLYPESVGRVRLANDRGLVSYVARRAEPINLDNAPDHPQFCYFPETGEEQYHGFLGVPIIHHREVLGVLVVQSHDQHRFNDDNENFLITVAAQLSGAIAHAEASGGIEGLHSTPDTIKDSRPLQGLPGAPGVGLGTARVVFPSTDLNAIPDRNVGNVEKEIALFDHALQLVKEDIKALSARFTETLPTEDLALFDAYLLMLDSHSFNGVTRERIKAGNWAPGAVRETVLEHEKLFKEMDDPYLRERGDDIRDLGRRLLERLFQESVGQKDYPDETILVGEEITATMLAEVPPEKLKAVISVRGSRTSHVAILARALGIPAVMGTEDLPVGRVDGLQLIADGYSGRVYTSPSDAIKLEFQRLADEELALSDELKELKELPAETQDGRKITLYVNTGLLSDISPAHDSGAEGVGLYRTEFPFMIRQRFPGEEEQRQIYREALESFAPKPVILRTLDVGGDKALPYFPITEENPFLGWRGIRITLDHPEIFLVQIRAMIRASVGLDNLNILLPMISDVSELNDALGLIHQAYAEILEEGEEVVMPKVGVMIEVPSAVYQAGSLARRVDFLSIGTNDLTQYLLAVDRNNPRVAELYDSMHPAVIRAMLQVVESARVHGKPVSVCGEMAGDPAAAILLVGMGIDSLSMSVSSLPKVKWVICNITRERASQILSEALLMEDVHSIRQHLNTILEDSGMGGLVRAGK